jgi:hypothetical protein
MSHPRLESPTKYIVHSSRKNKGALPISFSLRRQSTDQPRMKSQLELPVLPIKVLAPEEITIPGIPGRDQAGRDRPRQSSSSQKQQQRDAAGEKKDAEENAKEKENPDKTVHEHSKHTTHHHSANYAQTNTPTHNATGDEVLTAAKSSNKHRRRSSNQSIIPAMDVFNSFITPTTILRLGWVLSPRIDPCQANPPSLRAVTVKQAFRARTVLEVLLPSRDSHPRRGEGEGEVSWESILDGSQVYSYSPWNPRTSFASVQTGYLRVWARVSRPRARRRRRNLLGYRSLLQEHSNVTPQAEPSLQQQRL